MSDYLPIPLQRYLQRAGETNDALLRKDAQDDRNGIGPVEQAALTAVDGVTWAGDQAFNLGLLAADSITPEFVDEGIGMLTRQAVNAVVNSAPGQATQEWYNELTPQDQRRVSAGLEVAGLAGAVGLTGKAANTIARNASTFVRDFYSGSRAKAIRGMGEAFGLKGVPGALQEAFTPQGIARMRQTGIPAGVYSELKFMADLYKKLENKEFAKITGSDIKDIEAMRGRPGIRKYIAGELAMKYQILRQQGIDSPQLKRLVEDVQVVHTNTMDNMDEVVGQMFDSQRLGTQVPAAVRNHAAQKLSDQYTRKFTDQTFTNLRPDDLAAPSRTQIIVRANDAGANIRQEAFKGGPGGVLFKNAGKYKGLTQEQIADRINAQSWASLDDGWMVVRDSYSSSAKELGGVGRRTYFHPDSGELYSFIDDYSDILGFNPLGGQGLLVVSAPIRRNAYQGNKVYGNVDRVKEALPEVPMRPKKVGQGMTPVKGFDATQEGRMANQILNTQVTPGVQDYMTLGGRVGGTAGTAGLFGYTDEE